MKYVDAMTGKVIGFVRESLSQEEGSSEDAKAAKAAKKKP
jgi:hypothetical protein